MGSVDWKQVGTADACVPEQNKPQGEKSELNRKMYVSWVHIWFTRPWEQMTLSRAWEKGTEKQWWSLGWLSPSGFGWRKTWLAERACFSRESFNEFSKRQFVTSKLLQLILVALKLNGIQQVWNFFVSLWRVFLCMNIRSIFFCM